MKSTWRYRDIIDLEYFLHQDNGQISPADRSAIRERDRRIFLNRIEQIPRENTGRHLLLGQWLEGRRENELSGGNILLPGQLTEEIYTKLRVFFPALGVLTGFSAGLSFFTYTGTAPLNVFHYLAVFVFFQLFLLLLLAASLVVRAYKPISASSLLSSLIAGLLIRAYQAAAKRFMTEIPAEKRNSFQAILGIIRGKKQYSPLLFWPVFLLLQLFAIGFNAGLLMFTLYKVTVTDIAFGWQSTLQFSSEAIYHFVRCLALPWSMIGTLAYPTLQEIEGSRIILKDGIAHLATIDLIAWWPFLCLSLLVYGLLPRIALLLLAINQQKRCLGKLPFDQAVFDRLLVRMQTPLVSTQAEAEVKRDSHAVSPLEEDVANSPVAAPKGLWALVPDDIFDRCPDAELSHILAGSGYFLAKKIKIAEDYASDRKVLADLAAADANNQVFLILIEAWMPPVTDFVVFLKDLRKTLSKNTSIRIGLLGRPSPETIFTPAESGDLKVWRQKIDSLGDPYLITETFI